MSRFQAKTNVVLDAELESLRQELGLKSNQKADLLRELTTLATWVVRQVVEGRDVLAKGANDIRELHHPILEKIRQRGEVETTLQFNDEETQRLAEIMNQSFNPPPALRESLRRLASPVRNSPELSWPEGVA